MGLFKMFILMKKVNSIKNNSSFIESSSKDAPLSFRYQISQDTFTWNPKYSYNSVLYFRAATQTLE